jgi:prepilin-type N-terminal cleavage/methylation domain-containing protein
MIRKIFTASKKGFSLIELCIVLAIMAILTGSITSVFIRRIQIKAGEKTAQEMSLLQEAARAYFAANNAWPVSIQALQSEGYLNPSWVTNNPWQNPYIISPATNSFTVSTSVPQEWVSLVARDLPARVVSANTVSSTVPNPGSTVSEALPQGTIVIWSGSIASIPSGWVLCDGTNGTPDLRDKFIVGARQDLGSIARTNLTGSLTQSGGVSTLTGVSGSHQLTILELPSHQHTYTIAGDWRGSQTKASGGDDNPTGPWPLDIPTGSTGGNQGHTHTTEIPPYYALAFIMKV